MKLFFVLAASAALQGCTTAPELTHQAQHTASLVGELRQSIIDFHRQQRLVSYLTTESLVLQEKDIANANAKFVIDTTVRRAAGDTAGFVVADALAATADAVGVRSAYGPALTARLAEIASSTAASPANDDALLAAQRAALMMSEELSASTHWEEHRAFADVVRKSVKANRDAMQQANSATTAATK